MAWQPQQQVGPYVIQSHLGQGGMATVYRAYHPQLDRVVAIKVMHQNFLEDDTFIARFKREAQIVARLSHPHIVPVYDFDEHNGLPYLVMKYVPGITLKQRVRQQALTLDEILDVMTPVASALSYAHRQDILHRDVKPSNIVLDEASVPYLTDFGLARLTTSGESTMSADMLLGTPHYISPEQAKGERELDGRADIYSFGVVLYELMVGQVPFTADTPYAIIHDHIYTPPPQPRLVNPEIPQAVADILERALAKAPADRYADANTLISDLKDAIVDADLNALNANRAAVAAASIAELRHAAETPLQPAVQAPTNSKTYRTATLHSDRPEKNRRLWPISGCASFLIITLVSMFVLLNASNNLLSLFELVQGANTLTSTIRDDVQNLPAPAFAALGIRYEEEPFPVFVIPPLTTEQTAALFEDHDDEALTYLAHAHALWADDANAALNTLRRGYPLADNGGLYLTNAASIAEENDAGPAAISAVVSALEIANDETFDTIRPFATEFLYEAAQNANTLTAVQFNRTLGDMNITDDLSNPDLIGSEGALFVLARSFVARGAERLAANVLERIPQNGRLRAEFNLLEAELALQQNDEGIARRLLDAILEDDSAPNWTRERADTLLNQLENSET